jgi:hypothetical protein
MRPPSVYANPVCPAADSCDLLGLLHGPHRTGCRLVMILLSQQGFAAAQIAGLLGYDPSTVRRWIHCDDLAVVVAVEPDPVGPWPCARGVDLSARAAAPQGTTNQADVTS